jgi:hypothetical protein
MKNLYSKVVSLLSVVIMLFAIITFSGNEKVFAVSTMTWKEITPSSANTGQTPINACNPVIGTGYSTPMYDSYSYYNQQVAIDEVTTAGKRITHLFIVIPKYYGYAPSTYGFARIFHSSDNGVTWNGIEPYTYSKITGGSDISGCRQAGLKVITPTIGYWTSSNGSKWYGKLFLFTNNNNTTALYSGNMSRASLFRYDGIGVSPTGASVTDANDNWTPIAQNITSIGGITTMGTGAYYPSYWAYSPGSMVFWEMFNGKLYILLYNYLGNLTTIKANSGSTASQIYNRFTYCLFVYNGDLFATTPASGSTNGLFALAWQSPEETLYYGGYTPPVAFAMKAYTYAGTKYLIMSTASGVYYTYNATYYNYQYGVRIFVLKILSGDTLTTVGVGTEPTTGWRGELAYPMTDTTFITYIPGSPLCFEVFNGYLYAGFGTGLSSTYPSNCANKVLMRVQDVTKDLSRIANWQQCGAMVAGTVTQIQGVTALCNFKDTVLYIGGSYVYPTSPQSYKGRLWSTTGGASVPLNYTLEEDTWTTSFAYFYMFNDIYVSSVGIMVSFFRGSTTSTEPYGYRYFSNFITPPSAKIIVNPNPVVEEVGTANSFNFKLIPAWGWGNGNISLAMTLPPDIYLMPGDAPDNNAFLTATYPMNGNIVNLNPALRSSLSAVVNIPLNVRVTATDLSTGNVITYIFQIIIKPQTPGFSASVSPVSTQIAQGDCEKYTVDITSRYDFARDVIVNLVWTSPPPSGDVSFKWEVSPYINKYLSETSVNVRLRKNMTTRYFFTACTTSSTSLGTYGLRAIFISGSIVKYVDLTVIIVKQPASFTITPVPAIFKLVPGGTATYRVKIESTNGYVGVVSLSLESIPPRADLVSFYAENPPPLYPDNYVELTLSNPIAYADLEVLTYASYIGTDGHLVAGTPSGVHYIKVNGEGDGFDEDGNHITPTAYGYAGMQVFAQLEDMKTPTYDTKGMVLLLMAILGSSIFAFKSIDLSKYNKC